MALEQALKGLGSSLWANSSVRRATIGAGIGAAYGAFSDDWNVFSGALGGAAIALGTGGATKFNKALMGAAMSPGAKSARLASRLSQNTAKVNKYTGMGAGMALGGLYGAFSDDTSIMGGMMAGGMMGAGIQHFGVRPFMRRGSKGGIGQALRGSLSSAARRPKMKVNKAINEIRGLHSQFMKDLAM